MDWNGLKIIETTFLEPGTVLVMNPSALSLLNTKPMDIDLDPKPYDKTKCPPGHVPFHLVSEKVVLFDCDRYRLNNDLIDIFGTVPERISFRPFLHNYFLKTAGLIHNLHNT